MFILIFIYTDIHTCHTLNPKRQLPKQVLWKGEPLKCRVDPARPGPEGIAFFARVL